MVLPILTGYARLTPAQAQLLLECYAERLHPKQAAVRAGCSVNSVYLFFRRIRERLVSVGYYRDGALSFDEPGLAPAVSRQLRARRGIRIGDIHPHAAELIEWAEEWPQRLVLKHIRKIVQLTGPLDEPLPLSERQYEKLHAYVRYARTQLIHDRRKTSPDTNEVQRHLIERSKAALDQAWRDYRAASKRAERDRT